MVCLFIFWSYVMSTSWIESTCDVASIMAKSLKPSSGERSLYLKAEIICCDGNLSTSIDSYIRKIDSIYENSDILKETLDFIKESALVFTKTYIFFDDYDSNIFEELPNQEIFMELAVTVQDDDDKTCMYFIKSFMSAEDACRFAEEFNSRSQWIQKPSLI